MTRTRRTDKDFAIFSLFVLLLILASGVFAQPAPSTLESRVEKRVQVWKSELNLTAAQEQQVRTILLERERQWDADHQKLINAPRSDRPALRDSQQVHMQSYRDELHAVLTPAQQTKALSMREMRRGFGRRYYRQPNCPAPGLGMNPPAR